MTLPIMSLYALEYPGPRLELLEEICMDRQDLDINVVLDHWGTDWLNAGIIGDRTATHALGIDWTKQCEHEYPMPENVTLTIADRIDFTVCGMPYVILKSEETYDPDAPTGGGCW